VRLGSRVRYVGQAGVTGRSGSLSCAAPEIADLFAHVQRDDTRQTGRQPAGGLDELAIGVIEHREPVPEAAADFAPRSTVVVDVGHSMWRLHDFVVPAPSKTVGPGCNLTSGTLYSKPPQLRTLKVHVGFGELRVLS